MHLMLLPLFSLICLIKADTLYVVDCGEHGRAMMSVILSEGYNGNIVYRTAEVSGGSDCTSLESVDSVLWDIGRYLYLPARLSMSFAAFNASYRSITLEALLKRGVIAYASAGNSGDKRACSWPASQSGVIAVTALDTSGNLQPFSDGCEEVATAIGVSACSTSEATAIASARGLNNESLTRYTACNSGFDSVDYDLLCWIVLLAAWSTMWLY